MSPAAASTTAAVATYFTGLSTADKLVIDATLLGGTGGTLDVYLQRKVAADTWRDLVHFPQIVAATAKKYTVTINGDGTSIVDVGGGTDAVPAPTLAANSLVNCIPGGDVRIVFVSGSGNTVGASNSITITAHSERR